MANRVTLEFEGDADSLVREARRAQEATAGVGDASLESSRDMERAAGSSQGMGDRLSNLGNMASGALDAVGGLGDGIQAISDVMDAERAANAKLERALIDVDQARQDLTQSTLDGQQALLDGTQSVIDERQAQLDLRQAIQDHADAVSEYGAASIEAEQALIDQQQAEADLAQARNDGQQALADGTQATIDARSATQDLSDAQRELDPGPLQSLSNTVQTYLPLVSGLVSIVALATAAQWSLNFAFLANPMTWVVVGIVALVAAIVLIATKTRWFQDAWAAAWSGIRSMAGGVVDWFRGLPGAFSNIFNTIGNAISAPFRSAFAGIRNLWNSTVGGFGFTIPGWVPFVGGNSFRLPTMHTGGVVGGTQGSETVAILEAGERVIPRTGNSGGGTQVTFAGNTSDALATVIMGMIRTGQIQIVNR